MDDKTNKRNKLAADILRLSRNTLLVNLRFMDLALNQLQPEVFEPLRFASDGEGLFYDPLWILKSYKDEQNAIVRAYLHVILHCVFKHLFVHTLIDQELWNLACDIAVEYVIDGLNLPSLSVKKEAYQRQVFDALKKDVKQLTAEKIYHYYREKEALRKGDQGSARRVLCRRSCALVSDGRSEKHHARLAVRRQR